MYTDWKNFWSNKKSKQTLIIGIVIFIILLFAFPHFFNFIEQREGATINDFVLNNLPAINLSIPIFSIIWICAILTVWQCFQSPKILLLFLWGFIFLTFSRMATILLVPLNPPQQLIPLIDPISNSFYGGIFITKDLFYSGHTATIFLMYLCLNQPIQKKIVLVGTILVGIMVLIQHVHYTIDVFAAFPVTYFIFLATKKFLNFNKH